MAVDAGEGGVVVLFCFRAQRAGDDEVGYLWRGEGDGCDDFVACGTEVSVTLGGSGDVDMEVTEDAVVAEGDESEGIGFLKPGAGG